jgi:hypothetical protein
MAASVSIVSLDGYVSTIGAAKVMGYSRRMVRHLIKQGELVAKRNGKRAWKIRISDAYSCVTERRRIGKTRKNK